MPFVEQILNFRSVSIVGLEKNTGKTQTLNYLLDRLPAVNSSKGVRVAVTSIGVDGERIDQVTHTEKPEIMLRRGTVFTTSETHYRDRKLSAELLSVSSQHSALGRLITARVLTEGTVILSGPSTNVSLERWIKSVRQNYNVDLCIIDGALSRLSLASPTISDAIVLATGAALSIDMATLIRKTTFVVQLVDLPTTERGELCAELESKEDGIWLIDSGGKVYRSAQGSAFAVDARLLEVDSVDGAENGIEDEADDRVLQEEDGVAENSLDGEIKAIFMLGALTDSFLKLLGKGKETKRIELIVRDFTRIFVEPLTYQRFVDGGGRVTVLRRSKLLAITVNPVAPNGVVINSDLLCEELSQKTGVPVFDIVKNEYEV